MKTDGKQQFTPKDPDFASRVRESFARQPFMATLNAELTKLGPGFCEIALPYDIRFTQQHGYFHAGIVSTLADNAAGYAAYSLMEASSSILTVEFKLNLLAPADGQRIIGRSWVLKYGKTLTVCRSDVFVVKNGTEKLCGASQASLIDLKNTKDIHK